MSENEADKPAVLSEDEIEAALAEINSMDPEEIDRIPSLDDGDEDASQPPPKPKPKSKPKPQAKSKSAAKKPRNVTEHGPVSVIDEEESGSESAGEVETGGPDQAAISIGQRIQAILDRFSSKVSGLVAFLPLLRKKPAAPAEKAEKKSETGEGEAEESPLPLSLRVIDKALGLINAPFSKVDPSTRQTLGIVALVTVAMSLLATFVVPYLVPRSAALEFLERQVEAQQMAETEAPADPEDGAGEQDGR